MDAIDWWADHFCQQDFGITIQYATYGQKRKAYVKANIRWLKAGKDSEERAKGLPED